MARDEYIRIYRSSTPGAEPSLTSGEIAANLVDNKLFVGGTNGSLITFYADGMTGVITPGVAIDVVRTGNDVRIDNTGVVTFNGIVGGATLTGDGQAVQGKVNNTITVRQATNSLTGVASFNSNHFSVSNGAVSLASGVTGDTVVAGYGIDVVASGKTKTINNKGVTSFNGLTGNVTLTGDSGAVQGRDNNTITVREASTSVTGVASFNSNHFSVSNGAVSLASGYQVTGDTVVAGTNITITRNGNSVTVSSSSASSTTIVNGVTGIGFGNDIGLTGKINLTAGHNSGISITGGINDIGGTNVRQVTITNTGITGIRFPTVVDANDSYRTGAITLTGSEYISVYSTNGSTISIISNGVNTFNGLAGERTLTGDGVDSAVQGRGNTRITVREATNSLTGVASFNSNYFDVSNGAVSLKSAYQVTGDTVVAGTNITISRSNNSVTISSSSASSTTIVNGVTGIGFGNDIGLTGKINLTASSNSGISITGGINDIGGTNVRQVTITNTGITGIRFPTSFDGTDAYRTGAITITGSNYITVVSSDISSIAIVNEGVHTFNGLGGARTLTGDDGAILGKGNNKITVREATNSLTGVASFNSSYFSVSNGAVSLKSEYQVTGDTVVAGNGINIVPSNNQKTINNTGVTSFNGLTGNVTLTGDGQAIQGRGNNTITVREASTSVTGVASFNSNYFSVSNGAVSLVSGYQVTGDTVVAGNNITITRNGNSVTVSSSSASSTTIVNGVTGIGFGNDIGLTGKINITASPDSGISITGGINDIGGTNVRQVTITNTGITGIRFVQSGGDDSYRTGAITITGSDYISVLSQDGKTLAISNGGVSTLNGLIGARTLTGDSGAVQGRGNNRITVREASTSVTGVASFNSSYFDVSNGAVSLVSGYQVTGDTVVAGYGIDVVASGKTKTINNTGVTSFNGLTGNVTLTGDGQAIQGKGNNTITVREATNSLTGVASFNSSYFDVSNGAVSLKSAYQVTGDTVVAGTNITITRENNKVTINSSSASSTTIVNGVTGIGFGNDIGLTGKINLTASPDSGISISQNSNTITFSNTGITGIRFPTVFDANDSYRTGAITITGSNYISIFSGDSKTITISNEGVHTFNGLGGARTLTGDSGAVQGRGNNRITVREASNSLTGVASFNSSYFDVSNGAVSLKSAYQVTGDTVVAGNGINIVASNNQKTINNTGVTSFNGLAGNVTLTGDGQAIQGKGNNTITARVPNDCGITGVVGIKCSSGLGINADGLIFIDSGSACISCYGLDESSCLGPDCEWCITENRCVCVGQPCDGGGGCGGICPTFKATNSGMGVSANSDGSLAYLYLDVNNLATMGSTIESTDSVLFFDASESGLIKTKKASISKLILDNDTLFESKTPSQLTRNTKSSTIEFSVVLGSIAPNQQGLVKGASAHEYIAQNTVRSLNGMTGDLEFMINGCTGSGSGKITITGTQNEVNVSTSCPTIVIGLPDNVMIPYISVSGATFTETVSASLFIGSIAGGTF